MRAWPSRIGTANNHTSLPVHKMTDAMLERPVPDRQSLSQAFDERRADMWFRVTPARELLEKSKHAKFVPLGVAETDRAGLMGVRVYETGSIRDRWIADILIQNDRGDPEGYPPLPKRSEPMELYQMFQGWAPSLRGYSIEITYRRHMPKQVFETGNCLDHEANAQATADEFVAICGRLAELMSVSRLRQDFPAEWKGTSGKDEFVKLLVAPYRQAIGMGIFAFGVVAPFAMLVGREMSLRVLVPTVATLFFGATMLVHWIPGLVEKPIQRWARWLMTLFSVGIIALAWS